MKILFSNNLLRYNVAGKEATRCVFLTEIQKIATMLPEFLSTSLPNGMVHWNDIQRNTVANPVIESRSVWHYVKVTLA